MDFKNICEFWSLIEMHDLLVCNIIKTMPYNGCSQMVSISLKTKKSFIAHPWCLLSVVGLEKYPLGLVSRYSTVRSGTLTWREWGLWYNRSDRANMRDVQNVCEFLPSRSQILYRTEINWITYFKNYTCHYTEFQITQIYLCRCCYEI